MYGILYGLVRSQMHITTYYSLMSMIRFNRLGMIRLHRRQGGYMPFRFRRFRHLPNAPTYFPMLVVWRWHGGGMEVARRWHDAALIARMARGPSEVLSSPGRRDTD